MNPSIATFRSLLPVGGRLLGLDVGEKTIGLAVSDPGWKVATPAGVIQQRKFQQNAKILKIHVMDKDIGGLVIGLPVNMDGTEGPRCQSVRQFARNLSKQGIDLPALFWDERLSTVGTERVLIGEANLSRRRRKQVIDAAAATLILQGALEALRQQL